MAHLMQKTEFLKEPLVMHPVRLWVFNSSGFVDARFQ